MASTPTFLQAIARLFTPSRNTRGAAQPAGGSSGAPSGSGDESPGRSGTSATSEVDPRRIGRINTEYAPVTDGDADPGEIVWTWVPYEENDGRGKDRPVLVVAREPSQTVLAVELTSKEHPGRREYLLLGAGAWDGKGRTSWVKLDRVFRVHQDGMRREATALDRKRFDRVRAYLMAVYGWR